MTESWGERTELRQKHNFTPHLPSGFFSGLSHCLELMRTFLDSEQGEEVESGETGKLKISSTRGSGETGKLVPFMPQS